MQGLRTNTGSQVVNWECATLEQGSKLRKKEFWDPVDNQWSLSKKAVKESSTMTPLQQAWGKIILLERRKRENLNLKILHEKELKRMPK